MAEFSCTTFSSEVLAAQVVIYKVLGINRDLSIKCMEELMRRKELGDEFNFESYIEKEISTFEKPVQQNTLLRSLLKGNFNG